jgi:serine/threonine protein kinase
MAKPSINVKPPIVDGYELVNDDLRVGRTGLIGSGGFADVFLMKQSHPYRNVAMKVIRSSAIGTDTLKLLENEADIMARVSEHPNIVSVYEVGVSKDRRPFITMEYCPNPSYFDKLRSGTFSIDEVLELGVLMSGAIQTAHNSGIIHRDIKPANILSTAFGSPALTDFGISAVDSATSMEDAFSVPYSPPEVLASTNKFSILSDVYSLGATLYTLLSGKPPYVNDNNGKSRIKLIDSITREKLPRIFRDDLPNELFEILETALAKNPTARYSSARIFGEKLRELQTMLGYNPTRMILTDDIIVNENQFQSSSFAEATSPELIQADEDKTKFRPITVLTTEGDIKRKEVAKEKERSKSKTLRNIGIAFVTAIIIVGSGFGIITYLSNNPAPAPEVKDYIPAKTNTNGGLNSITQDSVPSVTNLKSKINGSKITFMWSNPEPKKGDSYQYKLIDILTESYSYKTVTNPTVTVKANEDDKTCIEVILVRETGKGSNPARVCSG